MYKKIIMDNGIRVVMEKIPHFRSVSIGLWFGVGSAYEKPGEHGMAHFIEHMLFKGTKGRSAKQIAESMDAVGGQINAFTAKECTCFYCKVMDEHLDLGLDLLSDMVLNSTFDSAELDKERGVIIEEIYMYDDSPEDLVHDLLAQAFYGEHPLSLPILGTEDELKGYNREQMVRFFDKYYKPENMVISIAGNYDEEQLMSHLNGYFGNWSGKGKKEILKDVVNHEEKILYQHKDIEQIHLCLASPGISMGRKEIYSLMIFNNIFGGGMSSRLFQKIREDRGLTYSVFSYPSNYTCGGMFTIYAGMKPAQVQEVLELIMDETNLIREKGITTQEFHMAREQLKGNYILGMESTSSRMNSIGKSELLLEKVMTPTEVIDKINSVSMDQVMEIIDIVLETNKFAAALVGPEDISPILKMFFWEGL